MLFLDAIQRNGLAQCCDTPGVALARRRATFEREIVQHARGMFVVASLLRTGQHPPVGQLSPKASLSRWLSRAERAFGTAIDASTPRTYRKLKYVPFFPRGKRRSFLIDAHTLVLAVLCHNAERRVAISALLSKRFAGQVGGEFDNQLARDFTNCHFRLYFEKVISS